MANEQNQAEVQARTWNEFHQTNTKMLSLAESLLYKHDKDLLSKLDSAIGALPRAIPKQHQMESVDISDAQIRGEKFRTKDITYDTWALVGRAEKGTMTAPLSPPLAYVLRRLRKMPDTLQPKKFPLVSDGQILWLPALEIAEIASGKARELELLQLAIRVNQSGDKQAQQIAHYLLWYFACADHRQADDVKRPASPAKA